MPSKGKVSKASTEATAGKPCAEAEPTLLNSEDMEEQCPASTPIERTFTAASGKHFVIAHNSYPEAAPASLCKEVVAARDGDLLELIMMESGWGYGKRFKERGDAVNEGVFRLEWVNGVKLVLENGERRPVEMDVASAEYGFRSVRGTDAATKLRHKRYRKKIDDAVKVWDRAEDPKQLIQQEATAAKAAAAFEKEDTGKCRRSRKKASKAQAKVSHAVVPTHREGDSNPAVVSETSDFKVGTFLDPSETHEKGDRATADGEASASVEDKTDPVVALALDKDASASVENRDKSATIFAVDEDTTSATIPISEKRAAQDIVFEDGEDKAHITPPHMFSAASGKNFAIANDCYPQDVPDELSSELVSASQGDLLELLMIWDAWGYGQRFKEKDGLVNEGVFRLDWVDGVKQVMEDGVRRPIEVDINSSDYGFRSLKGDDTAAKLRIKRYRKKLEEAAKLWDLKNGDAQPQLRKALEQEEAAAAQAAAELEKEEAIEKARLKKAAEKREEQQRRVAASASRKLAEVLEKEDLAAEFAKDRDRRDLAEEGTEMDATEEQPLAVLEDTAVEVEQCEKAPRLEEISRGPISPASSDLEASSGSAPQASQPVSSSDSASRKRGSLHIAWEAQWEQQAAYLERLLSESSSGMEDENLRHRGLRRPTAQKKVLTRRTLLQRSGEFYAIAEEWEKAHTEMASQASELQTLKEKVKRNILDAHRVGDLERIAEEMVFEAERKAEDMRALKERVFRAMFALKKSETLAKKELPGEKRGGAFPQNEEEITGSHVETQARALKERVFRCFAMKETTVASSSSKVPGRAATFASDLNVAKLQQREPRGEHHKDSDSETETEIRVLKERVFRAMFAMKKSKPSSRKNSFDVTGDFGKKPTATSGSDTETDVRAIKERVFRAMFSAKSNTKTREKDIEKDERSASSRHKKIPFAEMDDAQKELEIQAMQLRSLMKRTWHGMEQGAKESRRSREHHEKAVVPLNHSPGATVGPLCDPNCDAGARELERIADEMAEQLKSRARSLSNKIRKGLLRLHRTGELLEIRHELDEYADSVPEGLPSTQNSSPQRSSPERLASGAIDTAGGGGGAVRTTFSAAPRSKCKRWSEYTSSESDSSFNPRESLRQRAGAGTAKKPVGKRDDWSGRCVGTPRTLAPAAVDWSSPGNGGGIEADVSGSEFESSPPTSPPTSQTMFSLYRPASGARCEDVD